MNCTKRNAASFFSLPEKMTMFSPPTTDALSPFQVGISAGTMPFSSLKGAQGPSKNMAYSLLMPSHASDVPSTSRMVNT